MASARWAAGRLKVVGALTGAAAALVAACGARTGLDVPEKLDSPKKTCALPPGNAPSAPACDGGATTSISGTVYDPAGKNPLYGIVVFIPGSPPQPLPTGATCDSCSNLYTGNPIATALTDASGRFVLTDVPPGADVPLVIQIGKWRKQLLVQHVVPCGDNPQPDGFLTLPRNHLEGDIPNVAVSTGGADTLECILSRIGLDASEYGGGADGAGRIHVFQGSAVGTPTFGSSSPQPCPGGPPQTGVHAPPNTIPPGPPSWMALWDSDEDIMRFDMVLLSCEGQETANMNQTVLFDYAAAGGRVFASHFHYAWFNTGPFGAANLATWYPGNTSIQNLSCDGSVAIGLDVVTTLSGGGLFPKGIAMRQWLGNVGALDAGELPVENSRHNADVGPANEASQPWLVADERTTAPGATEYFSFGAPLAASPGDQCGEVIFSDLHVGAASADRPSASPVPQECAAGDLSPQEKALEFMLFDLSSCVTAPAAKPQPPPACTPSPQP